MLPYFKRVEEVSKFLQYVNGKAKTCLLVETPESALQIDKILELVGVDMVHIGLNDLHLALGMKFMFELFGGWNCGLAERENQEKRNPIWVWRHCKAGGRRTSWSRGAERALSFGVVHGNHRPKLLQYGQNKRYRRNTRNLPKGHFRNPPTGKEAEKSQPLFFQQ